MRLALGRVDASPFGDKEILELKADIITGLPEQGLKIKSSPNDSKDVPLDYRFKELLFSAAHDPEVSPGSGSTSASSCALQGQKEMESSGIIRSHAAYGEGRDGRIRMAEQLSGRRHTFCRSHRGIRRPSQERTGAK